MVWLELLFGSFYSKSTVELFIKNVSMKVVLLRLGYVYCRMRLRHKKLVAWNYRSAALEIQSTG